MDYTWPGKIDCPLKCDVPVGATLSPVPRPRHAWNDILFCPHADEGCELAFLLVPNEKLNAPRCPTCLFTDARIIKCEDPWHTAHPNPA